MKKTKGKLLGIAGMLLTAFVLWTLAVRYIDVQAIGPNGSSVGFAVLVLCVMPTAMMQLRARVRNTKVRTIVLAILAVFTACMVVGRLIAGVHWFTDIIGGILLSAGLVVLYRAVEKTIG